MSRTNKLSDTTRRSRLCKKILRLVAPKGMSLDFYEIACAANGFVPTLDNGMYLHWIIVEGAKEHALNSNVQKIYSLLADGLKDSYLLDPDNDEQLEYFADAMRDIVMTAGKENCSMLYESFFIGYRGNKLHGVYDFIKTLNKAFGFTSEEYFS